jgi:hypothetical protein
MVRTTSRVVCSSLPQPVAGERRELAVVGYAHRHINHERALAVRGLIVGVRKTPDSRVSAGGIGPRL